METRILLIVHAHESALLDGLARFSHVLGTRGFCTALVLSATLIHLRSSLADGLFAGWCIESES